MISFRCAEQEFSKCIPADWRPPARLMTSQAHVRSREASLIAFRHASGKVYNIDVAKCSICADSIIYIMHIYSVSY